IDDAALARVRAALPLLSGTDDATLRHWFGCFITRYRATNEAAPSRRALPEAKIAAALRNARVMRNPWSRVAWARSGRNAELFVAGRGHRCSIALARSLGTGREWDGAQLLAVAGRSGLPLVAELINAGHLHIVARR
ncbi:MAG TPA: winged helix domain-containing protein, partial [Rudaea sp.]